MASDGGTAYPFVVKDISKVQVTDPGMSVRDAFAMAVAGELYPTIARMTNADLAQEIYIFAQALTDEKLRRDKADRDEGKQPDDKV